MTVSDALQHDTEQALAGVTRVFQLDPVALKCPVDSFDRLRHLAKVVYLPTEDVYLVTGRDQVLEVLRDPATYSSARYGNAAAAHNYGEIIRRSAALAARDGDFVDRAAAGDDLHPLVLTHADPPTHTRQRALAQGAFSARRVRALQSDIVGLADRILDELCERETIDAHAEYSEPFTTQVICVAMDCPIEDAGIIHEWGSQFMRAFKGGIEEADLDEMGRARHEFDRYFLRLIESARREQRQDLLSALVRAELDGELMFTTAELLMVCQLLVSGATEAPSNALTNMLHHLAGAPGMADRLRREPSLVPGFIEESLRWNTSGQMIFRVATAEASLDGVTIPSGARVCVHLAAAGRDLPPDDRPELFDPERPVPQQLAFGNGPHFCLGAGLARAQLRVGLEQFLARVPEFRLDGDEGDLELVKSSVIRAFVSLPLRCRMTPPAE